MVFVVIGAQNNACSVLSDIAIKTVKMVFLRHQEFFHSKYQVRHDVSHNF